MKSYKNFIPAILILFFSSACGSDGSEIFEFPDGMIVYRLSSGEEFFAVNAAKGSSPVSLTKRLHSLSGLPSGGRDEMVSISLNGEWLVISTERFGSSGWASLAVIKSDLSEGNAVLDSMGNRFHTGAAAISSDGKTIVYQATDSGRTHLFVISNKGPFWSQPVKITAGSSYRNHGRPCLSADGLRVLFDCSMDSQDFYAQECSDIGIVNTNGTGLTVKIAHDSRTGNNPPNALRHPAFITGGIVFEADWDGEQIWLLHDGETEPVKITDTFHNDNSPCALSDGRIVSLWLGRVGNPDGFHEIKIMSADGSVYEMIVMDKDILDDTIGAGGP